MQNNENNIDTNFFFFEYSIYEIMRKIHAISKMKLYIADNFEIRSTKILKILDKFRLNIEEKNREFINFIVDKIINKGGKKKFNLVNFSIDLLQERHKLIILKINSTMNQNLDLNQKFKLVIHLLIKYFNEN